MHNPIQAEGRTSSSFCRTRSRAQVPAMKASCDPDWHEGLALRDVRCAGIFLNTMDRNALLLPEMMDDSKRVSGDAVLTLWPLHCASTCQPSLLQHGSGFRVKGTMLPGEPRGSHGGMGRLKKYTLRKLFLETVYYVSLYGCAKFACPFGVRVLAACNRINIPVQRKHFGPFSKAQC